MIIPIQNDWGAYFDWRSKGKPRPCLLKAVELMGLTRGDALDIAAGPLVDSKYLLEQGFDVTAIEREALAGEYQLLLPHKGRFKLVTNDIRDCRIKTGVFNLVSAQRFLVYVPPDEFSGVLDNLTQAIKPNGYFSTEFFGPKDCRNNLFSPKGSFHTKEQAIEECTKRRLKILHVQEICGPEPTSIGREEQMHAIQIIAQK